MHPRKQEYAREIYQFVFNQFDNWLIPSKAKKVHYDRILVLADLSSEQAHKDLDFYQDLARIHYGEVDTLCIGTKQDLQLKENLLDGLICTFINTGYGFDELNQQLQDCLVPNTISSPHPAK